ncbi:hypothetical protein ACFPK9_10665 [Rubritalea spongiae]|uniref:Uncharacterized protein n=1 Tax=Rubritalea spongiae TaxID=430797 RepID=A0ABW5E173_9BACT
MTAHTRAPPEQTWPFARAKGFNTLGTKHPQEQATRSLERTNWKVGSGMRAYRAYHTTCTKTTGAWVVSP